MFFYSSDMSRKGKINKALTAVTVIAVCLHIPPGKWRNREVNSAAFQSMADICLLFKCKNKQAKKPKGKETSWLSGMPARTSWRLVWNASGTIWMPLFLWLSFRPPFFILHFHSSITRPIIGLFFLFVLFYCSWDREKERRWQSSHLWKLSTLLIRMLSASRLANDIL